MPAQELRTVNLRLPAELVEKLRARANEERRSIRAQAEVLLIEALAQGEAPKETASTVA